VCVAVVSVAELFLDAVGEAGAGAPSEDVVAWAKARLPVPEVE
jgi:hypothetical protein